MRTEQEITRHVDLVGVTERFAAIQADHVIREVVGEVLVRELLSVLM